MPSEPQELTEQQPAPVVEVRPAENPDHELTPVPVLFDDRDTKLLEKLQNSAYENRRSLEQEILYRLDWSYDFHNLSERKRV